MEKNQPCSCDDSELRKNPFRCSETPRIGSNETYKKSYIGVMHMESGGRDLCWEWDTSLCAVSLIGSLLFFFFADSSLELYVLIHNLDSQMLRGERSQQILAQLSSLPSIYLIASIDHINAPLSEFSWV